MLRFLDACKTLQKRFENMLKTSENVLKVPILRFKYCVWRLQNVAETPILKTFWKRFENSKSVTFCERRQRFDDVLKRLANVLMQCWKPFIKLQKPSTKRSQNATILDVCKTLRKRFEELLKTFWKAQYGAFKTAFGVCKTLWKRLY